MSGLRITFHSNGTTETRGSIWGDSLSMTIKHIAERVTQAKIDHQYFLAICEAYPTLTGKEIDDADRTIANYVLNFQTLCGSIWES